MDINSSIIILGFGIFMFIVGYFADRRAEKFFNELYRRE